MCTDCLEVLCGYCQRPARWRSLERLRLERFLDTFTVLSCQNVLVRLDPFLKLGIAVFIVRMQV